MVQIILDEKLKMTMVDDGMRVSNSLDGRVSCQHDFDKPIRKGRARYACPKCGQDISLELVMVWECTQTLSQVTANDSNHSERAEHAIERI